MKPTIGFAGLGLIGMPMAERLQEQGMPLVVWNRTAEKAESLVRRGATRSGTPRELAARAEIVITMLTDGAAVESVTLRPDGISAGLSPGKVHCDMSTMDPGTSRRLAEHYAGRDVHFLHAPVLGNKHAARAGTLLVFAGGPQEGLEKCAAVFAALGQRTWHWAEPPTATCVKLACNLLLGGMMELLSESLVLAARVGVEPGRMLEVIGRSALAAPMFQAKGRAIVERNFAPNFTVRNMLKDLNLALDASTELGVKLPGARAVRGAFARAAEQGFAELDYSAVVTWLERQLPTHVRAK